MTKLEELKSQEAKLYEEIKNLNRDLRNVRNSIKELTSSEAAHERIETIQNASEPETKTVSATGKGRKKAK